MQSPFRARLSVFLCGIVLLVLVPAGCAELPTRGGQASVPLRVERVTVPVAAVLPGRAPIQNPAVYGVSPGDRLSVHILDNPDLSQEVVVRPDGRITYPLVGSLKVDGLSLETVARLISSRLERSLVQPEVTVKLVEVGADRIFVIGEVLEPGAFDITEQISVVQAISLAGGFTVFADRTNIVVYNPGRATGARRVFNYRAFLANPAAYDFALRPGDTVIVQ